MSKTRHIEVSLPFGEGYAQVTGYYTRGLRSNNYDEPDDAPEFELDRIVVGGVDITEALDTALYLKANFYSSPSYENWLDCFIEKHWDSIIEQCEGD